MWLSEARVWKKKAKLCFMDTGSFIVYIKIEDMYVDIGKDCIEC